MFQRRPSEMLRVFTEQVFIAPSKGRSMTDWIGRDICRSLRSALHFIRAYDVLPEDASSEPSGREFSSINGLLNFSHNVAI